MTDRTVVYRLRVEASQFKHEATAAKKLVKDTADEMAAATKRSEDYSKGLTTLGNTAGKVGLVAAAGLGATVIKSADFDQAMSKVQAATHESASAMEDLRQAALDAGADTAFSATEAAAGIENLAKAGVATTDILDGGLSGALSLAAAGKMEVADAAEAAAGAMAQFKLEGEQVPHIADLLAAAAGKAQGEVSDMTLALKQGGTVAAQTGLSLEETVGSLAAMAEQSLLGSDAGTSFKTMLASLTPNSDKAAAAMERYNIHAFDAQGNFVGMTALAGQLRAGLGELTDEQRAMALETIFGSDAVRAASIIYDNGAEGIAEWTAKVNDAGYAAETAAIKQDNLRGDIEKLGGALETALIGTGDGAQGPLRSLTQSLESVVNGYNGLGQAAKSGVALTLGATALLGGGLFVFSKVVQGIANTRTALSQLGVTATATKGKLAGALGVLGGPWGLALTAATIGIGAYMKSNADAEARVTALTEAIDAQTGELSDNAAAVVARQLIDEGWNDENLKQYGTSIDEMTQAVLGGIDGFSTLAEKIESTKGGLGGLLGTSTQDDIVGTMVDVRNGLADAKVEQESFAGATKDTESATESYTAATDGLGGALITAADRAKKFKDVLDGLNGVLDGRANLRDYQAALDDFTTSLEENGNTFDINTAKGRDNQAALDNIAGSALAVAENMRGAARQKFLTNAIADLRTMGEDMNLPKAQVQALIDLLRTAHRTGVKPKIDVDTIKAMTAIERVRNALLGLKDKSVTVRVTQTGTALTPGFGPDLGVRRKAGGGLINGPGTSTSDSIPAYVSNKEYVVKAAAVEKYGVHTFDRLNAMNFAAGGVVAQPLSGPTARTTVWSHPGMAASSWSLSLSSADIDRLEAAMLRARPLHGDVLIKGDPSEYKRQMRRSSQAVGLGGRPV